MLLLHGGQVSTCQLPAQTLHPGLSVTALLKCWLACMCLPSSQGSESADIVGGDEDGVTLEDSFIVEDSEAEARALQVGN
jgi:hypothetical protein